jgi:hypothetical protein
MWTSIFLNILISIIIIYLGHQLWEYLRDKYSTKKTVDLVASQTQKYKQMLEEIQFAESNKTEQTQIKNTDTNMEDELASFIDTI